MFPKLLNSTIAFDMAQTMLAGFNRHYALFQAESAQAKQRFEQADWHGQQSGQRARIMFYDLRVRECVAQLETDYQARTQSAEVWHQAKLHYIGLLIDHCQPELAETFFNSVITQILERRYFQNDFIFLRPAISTEYIQSPGKEVESTYRAYYPLVTGIAEAITQILQDFDLQVPFEDLPRDVARIEATIRERAGGGTRAFLRQNFQIQVLSALFYRNKCAYLIGKIINGFEQLPVAIPLLHNDKGEIYADAVLCDEDDIQTLFSFARSYFLVAMEIPSAFVQFLRSLMPRKPRNEIYNALGLAKQGKNLFYRDFLQHLRHSSDHFRIAPGIKGMVMLVFDLPSFPYVFKLIKDYYPPQKDTTRAIIKSKYNLVKNHDRVGRMADTLEYSSVAFPRARFEESLIAEILEFAPSQIEFITNPDSQREEVIIKHLYIERRMIPLNMYLQEAFENPHTDSGDRKIERSVIEYGNAIKDLVAANIFPGDMLWKNFGVTRNGKVVFYDYDEIEYITDCNFRKVPQARNEEDEMSGEVWYPVGKYDVFPETFAPFLLGNPRVKAAFMRHHADLLEADYWQRAKEAIQAGYLHDVFPYEQSKRFARPQGESGALR